MFKQNQKVFYPKHCVGTIISTSQVESKEGNYLSYVIEFKISGETISLPVSEAPRLGLRPLSSKEVVQEVLSILSQNISPSVEESWKDRKKEVEDLFSSGDLKSLGILVKVLFDRHQYRSLGTRERQVYEQSYDFLVNEMALVSDDSEANVEHKISEQILLSQSGSQAGDSPVL